MKGGIVKVKDIINLQGKFVTLEQLKTKYSNANFSDLLLLYGMYSSFPSIWREIIQTNHETQYPLQLTEDTTEQMTITVNNEAFILDNFY